MSHLRSRTVGLSLSLNSICWASVDHTSRVITSLGLRRIKLEHNTCPVTMCHKVHQVLEHVPSAHLYAKYRVARLKTCQLNLSVNVARSTVALSRLHSTVNTVLYNRQPHCDDDSVMSEVAGSQLLTVNAVDVLRPLNLMKYGAQLTCSHLVRRLIPQSPPNLLSSRAHCGDVSELPTALRGWTMSEEAASVMSHVHRATDNEEMLARSCLLAIMCRRVSDHQFVGDSEESRVVQHQQTASSVSI